MEYTNERIDEIKQAKNALTKAKKENNMRMFGRYLAIFLYLKREITIKEIADTIAVSSRTIDKYIASYKKSGLDGLQPKKQKGAKCKLTFEQEQILKDVIINQYPADVGYPSDYNWTASLVCVFCKDRFNVHYSRSGMTEVIKRLGFSYTRATYVLKKADMYMSTSKCTKVPT